MRKCAAILCAAVVTVSVCACGEETAPTKKTDLSRYHISTTATTTPTVNYNEEAGDSAFNFTAATAFSDGVAFVRYLDDEGVACAAAIDTEGRVLFRLPEGMPFDGPGYTDGIRVVDNVIYDKTGAVIASPEKSGYDLLLTGSYGGKVLAKKTEVVATESTDATATDTSATASATSTTTTTAPTGAEEPVTPTTIVKVGVLNSQGEWVHALSADHPLAPMIATAQFHYVNGDVMRVVLADDTQQYYHFSDNTLTVDYVRYASFGYTPEESAGIYEMAKDGTKTLKLENIVADYFFADAFIGRTLTPPAITETEPTLGVQKLYDYEGNELMDLSAYTIGGEVYYEKGYLTFRTTNEVGSRLLMVLGQDGNPVFEPVELGMRDILFRPDANGFVVECCAADGAIYYRHYDYTGVVMDYTDVATFAGFADGLAAVTLRGDAEHRYYINHRAEIVLR